MEESIKRFEKMLHHNCISSQDEDELKYRDTISQFLREKVGTRLFKSSSQTREDQEEMLLNIFYSDSCVNQNMIRKTCLAVSVLPVMYESLSLFL